MRGYEIRWIVAKKIHLAVDGIQVLVIFRLGNGLNRRIRRIALDFANFKRHTFAIAKLSIFINVNPNSDLKLFGNFLIRAVEFTRSLKIRG